MRLIGYGNIGWWPKRELIWSPNTDKWLTLHSLNWVYPSVRSKYQQAFKIKTPKKPRNRCAGWPVTRPDMHFGWFGANTWLVQCSSLQGLACTPPHTSRKGTSHSSTPYTTALHTPHLHTPYLHTSTSHTPHLHTETFQFFVPVLTSRNYCLRES